MIKGKLIVIEGTDGSGKATQHRLLLEYFRKNNISFAAFDFPQYEKTFFGNFVGRFLNGEFGHLSRINPYLAIFPYAGDRWQVKEDLYKALEEGKVVICNRYAPSIAFQVVKVKPSAREKFLKWAGELEYKVFGIPREDLVVFLYVPFEIAQELLGKKAARGYLNGKSKDIHEENVEYQKRVEKMYLWLSKTKKNWVKIDCVDKKGKLRSIEEIHKEVIKILKNKNII